MNQKFMLNIEEELKTISSQPVIMKPFWAVTTNNLRTKGFNLQFFLNWKFTKSQYCC